MKSVELRAKTPTDADSELWLRDIRAEQSVSLASAFGHNVAKRRLELASAFSAGLLVSAIAQCFAIVFGQREIVALVMNALLLAIAIAVTFIYQRAANRAFLLQAEFQKRASSAIRIVQEEPAAEKPAVPPTFQT